MAREPAEQPHVPAPAWMVAEGATTLIRVKAVPGASRDQVVGPLGDRLKVRVAAPPEAGRANEAIARLLAEHLGAGSAPVTLVQGHSSALKVFRVRAPAGRLRPAG